MLDAYYSDKACEYGDPAIYISTDGTHVAVTEVVECGRKPVSNWPDLRFIGNVIKCEVPANDGIDDVDNYRDDDRDEDWQDYYDGGYWDDVEDEDYFGDE